MMSLTANELLKQYMAMTFEEREQFLLVFKQLYDSRMLASKPMSARNRAALLEKQEREEKLND
jgi:hypothetical protein